MLKHYELERISVNREHWAPLSEQTHHTQADLIVPAESKAEAARILDAAGYPNVRADMLRLAGGNQYAGLAESGVLQAGRIYVVPMSRAEGVGEITSPEDCKRIGRLKMKPGSDFKYRFIAEGPSMREELEQLAARIGAEEHLVMERALRGRIAGELREILGRHPEGGK